MAMTYFPPEDIHSNVCRAIRAVMADASVFRISEAATTINVDPATNTFVFPQVGIDFRSVIVHGNSHPFTISVNTPNGLSADLIFAGHEPAALTLDPYVRWSTYFVGDLSDVQYDIFTYFGDTELQAKRQVNVPMCVPFVEEVMTQFQAGQGETAYIRGSIVMLGNTASGGLRTIKAETGKLFHAARKNASLFTEKGMKGIRLHPPMYSTYSDLGGLYESVTPFSAYIRFAPEGISTPIPRETPNSTATGLTVVGSTYRWIQVTPLAEWVIQHDLNTFPSVVLVDTSGVTYYPAVSYTDQNTLVIDCGMPFAGTAYLNV